MPRKKREVIRPRKKGRERYIKQIVKELQEEYKSLSEDRIRERLKDVPDKSLRVLLQASPYRGMVWNILTSKEKHARLKEVQENLRRENRANVNRAVSNFLESDVRLEDRELRKEVVEDLKDTYLSQDSAFFQCSFDIERRLEEELERRKKSR